MSQNRVMVPVDVPRPTRVSGLILDRCSDLTHCGATDYDSAPWVNRTPNLMIKSQLQGEGLARTGAVYLGFQATNDAELVPPAHPKSARQFHATFVCGSSSKSQFSRVKPRQKSSIETAVRRAGHTEHALTWTVTDSPPLKAKGPLLDKLAARVNKRGE